MKHDMEHEQQYGAAPLPPEPPFERGCKPNGAFPPPHRHRERAVGIGYGNSSGYGATLHFVDGHVDPMFRLRW